MRNLSWILAVAFAYGASAREVLTPPAVFARCYAQLTQTRVAPDDALLAQVQAGTKSAVAACMEVFDKARFATNGMIPAATRDVGKLVLQTMHRVHASWFLDNQYTTGVTQVPSTADLYDMQSPAFYFDRAMFQPGVKFNYVVTGAAHLKALRTDMDPATGQWTGHPKTDWIFDSTFRLAPLGELLGVQETGILNTPYNYTVNSTVRTGSIELGKHYGGGILGSIPYLLLTVSEAPGFRSNGAEAMPRKWSRAVFSDLLCRELPVVRYADVSTFRVAGSTVPFRATQGCVQCHASMDRMAAGIRGFGYTRQGNINNNDYGGDWPLFTPSNGMAGTEWPSAPQTNYYQKEPDGVFYFRNYKGVLRNVPFRGPTALGTLLAGEEDLYVCAAKRYYSYFMGVDVAEGDPVSPPTLTTVEAAQKKHVEDLGKALKADANQSLRTLVRTIFELPAYRNSDFSP